MLKLEDVIRAKAKENQIRKPESVPQISAKQKIETAKELEKLAGVSHDTIHQFRYYVNTVFYRYSPHF
ncbi:MAG: hypothetical protein VB122_04115 [Erysipelotrichales bacterium]|nr:hypothetical protein [Erysipelotrichales bacterium]